MSYPLINGTIMGSDLSYMFVYANSITHGIFMPIVVIAFFSVVLIISLMMQLRFTGNIKPETSFAAACFATLGLETILAQKTGLISAPYIILTIGLTILSVLWLIWDSE